MVRCSASESESGAKVRRRLLPAEADDGVGEDLAVEVSENAGMAGKNELEAFVYGIHIGPNLGSTDRTTPNKHLFGRTRCT